ncbi:MAG: DNA mismatch repair protein MutS [bacterium]
MRQFLEIKSRLPDAILFFQMGDFFEMFYEDARVAAKALELTLTSRQKDDDGPIPMCGVPIHAASAYSARLIEAGHKVAICEQVENASQAKGIVKREVVRVLTPGTAGGAALVDSKEACYLAGAVPGAGKSEGEWGLAWVDLSTGEFGASEISGERAGTLLADELERLGPRELLIPGGAKLSAPAADRIGEIGARTEERGGDDFSTRSAPARLAGQFSEDEEIEARAAEHPLAAAAAAALLSFIQENQPGGLPHLRPISFHRLSDTMRLDAATRRNLELVRSAVDGGRQGTLLNLLDETLTAMGGRLMRRWVLSPLIDSRAITHRADAVEEFWGNPARLSALRETLAEIQDLERILGRVGIQTANARDLLALGNSLAALPALREALEAAGAGILAGIREEWDSMEDLCQELCASLLSDPPLTIREGGMIREGVDPELDRLRAASREGKNWIESYAAQERERTGLPVKVGFNRVFGFYLELPKRFSEDVPLEYTRKQTLVSAERYITEALKKIEDEVLGAEEKAKELEYLLFGRIRACVASESRRILLAANRVARLDALASLAVVAERRNYVRPAVDEGEGIVISEGRHPVIESDLSVAFVPNDLRVGGERQILIVTGPNMAGKSTYLRQSALIILMAQMGSFVPAASARIGLVDRVFTRVGAHDRLLEGQSTFMVEMLETATILREATARSFVVLDEVGRGTSTYDGVSIAWAVTEYLHESAGHRARTLFATHYHELAELSKTLPRVSNLTVEVREWGEEVVFLRKVSEGSSDRSYGIHVGRLAGLPDPVISRAKEILAGLEGGEGTAPRPKAPGGAAEEHQLPLFEKPPSGVEAALSKIDPDGLSPREAIEKIYELSALLDQSRGRGDSRIEE